MKNKQYIVPIIAFIVGGAVASFLLPEKIKKVTEKEIVEVEKIVEKEVEIEKIVYRDVIKEVVKSEKKIKRELIKPDGTIIREEIYESNEEQLTRVKESEEQKYKELLAMKETEYQERYKKTRVHSNPKRISAGIGYNPLTQEFAGNAAYTLFGPVTAGVIVTANGIYPTIGVRF